MRCASLAVARSAARVALWARALVCGAAIAHSAPLAAQSSPPIVGTRADSVEQVRVRVATADTLGPTLDRLLTALTDAQAPSDEVTLWRLRATRAMQTPARRAEARTVWADCLRRFPSDRPCQLGLATVAAWDQDFPQAEAQYQALLTADPTDLDARLGLAYVVWWRGQPREARRHFLAIQGIAPRRPEAYRALAEIADQLGERGEAQEWREAAQRVSPSQPRLRSTLPSPRWEGGHELWVSGGGTQVPGLADRATEWRADLLWRLGRQRLSVGLGQSQFGPSGQALPAGVIAPQGMLWVPTLGLGPDGPRRHGLSALGYGILGDSVRATGVWIEPWIGLGGTGPRPRVRVLGVVRPERTWWPQARQTWITGGGLSLRAGRHELGSQTWHLDAQMGDAQWLQQLSWDAGWHRRLETRVVGQRTFGRSREAQTLGVRVRLWPLAGLGLQGEWWHRDGFAARETVLLGLGLRW